MAGTKGLEPSISGVTGQRPNQLNHVPDRLKVYYLMPPLSNEKHFCKLLYVSH